MRASYKEHDTIIGIKNVHLMPGQFIFGRKKASQETGLTEREIRTCVKFLENNENVTIKTTNKFSIISVINWHLYQQEETTNDQTNDQQTTSKRPANDQQTTTYKKGKKGKKGKNIKTFSSDSEEIRLAEFLFSKILEKSDKFKKPNFQAWAKSVDLMIRVDKRSPEDIKSLIEWCQGDPFWSKNILSTAKLREKFDQLWIKKQDGGGNVKMINSKYFGLIPADSVMK